MPVRFGLSSIRTSLPSDQPGVTGPGLMSVARYLFLPRPVLGLTITVSTPLFGERHRSGIRNCRSSYSNYAFATDPTSICLRKINCKIRVSDPTHSVLSVL